MINKKIYVKSFAICFLLLFFAPMIKAQDFVLNGKIYSKEQVFRFIPVSIPIKEINISSLYGMRKHPVLGYSKKHEGADFYAPVGTPVYSTGFGVVIFAGNKGSYGNVVEIKHGIGYTTRYAHLSKIAVIEGQMVDRNKIVGLVGATGRVTGPHLHYEIRHNGKSLDPIKFIINAYEVYNKLE